jgi:hypothetical protein
LTRSPRGLGHFHPENEIAKRFPEELDSGTGEEWIPARIEALRRAAQRQPGGRGAGAGPSAGLLERQFELAMEPDAVHTVSREFGVGSPDTLVEPEDMRSYLILEFDRGAA